MLEGHLGGRSSSFGESKGRGSKLEVSRSFRNMSLISASFEGGVSRVLEKEISKSLPLTGLLAPSLFAKELEGEAGRPEGLVVGREGSSSVTESHGLSHPLPAEAPPQLPP